MRRPSASNKVALPLSLPKPSTSTQRFAEFFHARICGGLRTSVGMCTPPVISAAIISDFADHPLRAPPVDIRRPGKFDPSMEQGRRAGGGGGKTKRHLQECCLVQTEDHGAEKAIAGADRRDRQRYRAQASTANDEFKP